jgi:hypothetical protein
MSDKNKSAKKWQEKLEKRAEKSKENKKKKEKKGEAAFCSRKVRIFSLFIIVS